jgi:2-amino-4-hydroxy-6-hydroxymethyldihydropteridine diphosphokinase
MNHLFLGLGSNLGNRYHHLKKAFAAIRAQIGPISNYSHIYESAPQLDADQNHFLNAVIITTSDFSPEKLLNTVKQIEQELGRRPTRRYGPRIIDIDILFYGSIVYQTTDLVIPHIEIIKRAFVIRPLLDVVTTKNEQLLKEINSSFGRTNLENTLAKLKQEVILKYEHQNDGNFIKKEKK